MNRLKNIFTPKRVAIFFLSIFLILFFAGGCSFKYMDWQYYKFKSLCENEAGRIILNETLYEDYRNPNYKQHKPSDIYRGRILEFSRGITYYDKKIISIHRGFIYYNYGIFFSGDEGGGFNLNLKKEIGCTENNRFKRNKQ